LVVHLKNMADDDALGEMHPDNEITLQLKLKDLLVSSVFVVNLSPTLDITYKINGKQTY